MMNRSEQLSQELVQVLDRLVKVYRLLLETVRTEKEHLISVKLEELSKNNQAKELSLRKAHALEKERQTVTRDLVKELGLKVDASLLQIASHFTGLRGEELRSKHAVLELIVKRLIEYNRDNEVLALSALKSVTGAMESIKESLQEKVTYERKSKGQEKKRGTAKNSHSAGQLVRREA